MMHRLTLLIVLSVCGLAAFLMPIPSHAQTSALPALESLPPCHFTAYTERDDLIIGAVVLNLETGAGCVQNLYSVFPIASVGKLFVAGALYQAVAEGRVSFETELVFSADYLMGGRDDCLTEEQVGLWFTIGYLGNIMIQCSDNVATWMLMDYLGWDTVSAYAQSLGISGIGEIIPYSEVDRLKLTFLDPRWANVPRHLASQFYRRRFSEDERIIEGLVPTYFDEQPRYTPQQLRDANARYLETYPYNTATPDAIARYLLKLRDDLLNGDEAAQLTARWTFNTMLLTQRMFSTQYMPGTVFVGSKNGFDLGYRAEVNITVNDLDSYLPQTLSFIAVRHRDVSLREIPFRFRSVPTTDFLLALAPHLTQLLYPDANLSQPPPLVDDQRVRKAVINTEGVLNPCYQNFLNYGTLNALQNCWRDIPNIDRISRAEKLGFGLILRNLHGQDVRLTLIFTLPDGTLRSYQMQRFFEDVTGVAWFEEVDMPGVWRLDVYFNLAPIFSAKFYVE